MIILMIEYSTFGYVDINEEARAQCHGHLEIEVEIYSVFTSLTISTVTYTIQMMK